MGLTLTKYEPNWDRLAYPAGKISSFFEIDKFKIIMFFIYLNQSWGFQTNIFETNIINLAFQVLVFSNFFIKSPIFR